MSLEFNRRSFLKYTAVAAVAVAGSSLLTGCGSDEYQPTGRIGDTLTLMGKQTMYSVSSKNANNVSSSVNGATLICALKLNCTADHGNSVLPTDFEVKVTKKSTGKTTTYYATNTDGTGNITLSKATPYLAKDASWPTELKLVAAEPFANGDTIEVKYWPKQNASEGSYAYRRAYCTWKITVKAKDVGTLTLE